MLRSSPLTLASPFGLRVLLLALLLPLAACSSDPKPEEPAGPATFTADRPAYEPLQWGVLTLGRGSLALDTQVGAELDAQALTLRAVSDHELLFVVPDDGRTGARTLRFTAAGVDYEGTLQVAPAVAPLADPTAYLAQLSTQLRDGLDAALARLEASPDAALKERARPVLEETRRKLAEQEAAVAAMGAADRAALAHFLRANLKVRGGGFGRSVAAEEACEGKKDLALRHCLLVDFGFGVVELGRDAALTIVSAALVPASGGWSLFGVAYFGFVTTLDVFDVIERWGRLNTVTVATVDPEVTTVDGDSSEDFTLETVDGTRSPVLAASTRSAAVTAPRVFTHGELAPFHFRARYRSLREADRSSKLGWAAQVAEGVARLNAFVTGKLGAGLTLPFPAPATERIAAERSQVQVSILTNPRVRLAQLEGTGADLRVAFTSDETTAQDFVFEVLYTSGISPPVRVRYAATLRPARHKLAFMSGQLVPPSVQFTPGVEARFTLSLEDGSPVAGFDASQLSVSTGTTAGIAVTGRGYADSIGVTLSASGTSATETLFDVLYRGARVLTLQGRIAPLEYTVEVQKYHPDYTRMTTTTTLQPHDAFMAPNGLIQYFRVRYRGQYVQIGGFGTGVERRSFYQRTRPPRAEDEEVADYRLQFTDETNGRVVFFPLHVTLRNDAFRRIVGSTVRVSRSTGELIATYTFHADGTVSTPSGVTTRYTQFSGPGYLSASFFETCPGGIEMSTDLVGYVTGFPVTIDSPSGGIMVRADSTLMVTSCPGYTVQ